MTRLFDEQEQSRTTYYEHYNGSDSVQHGPDSMMLIENGSDRSQPLASASGSLAVVCNATCQAGMPDRNEGDGRVDTAVVSTGMGDAEWLKTMRVTFRLSAAELLALARKVMVETASPSWTTTSPRPSASIVPVCLSLHSSARLTKFASPRPPASSTPDNDSRDVARTPRHVESRIAFLMSCHVGTRSSTDDD